MITTVELFKTRASFWTFSSFLFSSFHVKIQKQIETSVDAVLGIQTLGAQQGSHRRIHRAMVAAYNNQAHCYIKSSKVVTVWPEKIAKCL